MYDFEFALVVGEWLFRICIALGTIGLVIIIFNAIKNRIDEKREKKARDEQWSEILRKLR